MLNIQEYSIFRGENFYLNKWFNRHVLCWSCQGTMVIFQGNTELYYNHTPNVYDDEDSHKTCISTRINNGCTKSTWSHSVDI